MRVLLVPILALLACDDSSTSTPDSQLHPRILKDAGRPTDSASGDPGQMWQNPDSSPADASPPRPDAQIRVDSHVPQRPSPDEPQIDCLTDQDCPNEQVCCSRAIDFSSQCVSVAECSGGNHDACHTDAQCAARRPGQWSVCCHDHGNRNYCAPVRETCQPLVPCTEPADCLGNGTDTCCSPHPYYNQSWCTSEFFAAAPLRECL